MSRTRVSLAGIAVWLFAGATLVTAQSTPAAGGDRTVTIHFEATVGDAPAACGRTYSDVGRSGSSVTITDFRLYVMAVRLMRADGTDVPVALSVDDLWQQDDVALLDFEDGTQTCANGTPETRYIVEGRVPDGQYTGVRFRIGVPFARNHRDPTLQPSPLNLSRMFWTWNAGYKFLRLDLRTSGQPQGWVVHLGSTGCTPGATPLDVPTTCRYPNDVSVDLPAFDPDRDVVRVDLSALLAEADVDTNQPDTAAGCMSSRDDRDCTAIFQAIGLPFGEAPGGNQRVFSVARPSRAETKR